MLWKSKNSELSFVSLREELDNLSLQNVSLSFFEGTDSTNVRARLAVAAGEISTLPTLFAAKEQSSGRGRFQRKFYSEPGGAYMSLVLPLAEAPKDTLTALVAVAAARAIERLADVEIKIKWVNDLYLSGKKLAGILCEGVAAPDSGMITHAIIGIGINVHKAGFPNEISGIATNLESECGVRVPIARLIAHVTKEILALLESPGEGIIEEYRARSSILGRRVEVLRGGERFFATASDIDFSARLKLSLDNGEEIYLSSGEISVKPTEI